MAAPQNAAQALGSLQPMPQHPKAPPGRGKNPPPPRAKKKGKAKQKGKKFKNIRPGRADE